MSKCNANENTNAYESRNNPLQSNPFQHAIVKCKKTKTQPFVWPTKFSFHILINIMLLVMYHMIHHDGLPAALWMHWPLEKPMTSPTLAPLAIGPHLALLYEAVGHWWNSRRQIRSTLRSSMESDPQFNLNPIPLINLANSCMLFYVWACRLNVLISDFLVYVSSVSKLRIHLNTTSETMA